MRPYRRVNRLRYALGPALAARVAIEAILFFWIADRINFLVDALEVAGEADPIDTDALLNPALEILALAAPVAIIGMVALGILAIWSYSAHNQLRALQASDTRFNSVLVAVLWIIPVVGSLAAAYALNELWRASGPQIDWRRNAGTLLVIPLILLGILQIPANVFTVVAIATTSGETQSILDSSFFKLSIGIGLAPSMLFAITTSLYAWRLTLRQDTRHLMLSAADQEDRLAELDHLLQQGLITHADHYARRQKIRDDI
jgi:hypothetical protein